MASAAQASMMTGNRAIRTVPRVAMVARRTVNSLSARLMTASPTEVWHLFWTRPGPGTTRGGSTGAHKIVIDAVQTLLQPTDCLLECRYT